MILFSTFFLFFVFITNDVLLLWTNRTLRSKNTRTVFFFSKGITHFFVVFLLWWKTISGNGNWQCKELLCCRAEDGWYVSGNFVGFTCNLFSSHQLSIAEVSRCQVNKNLCKLSSCHCYQQQSTGQRLYPTLSDLLLSFLACQVSLSFGQFEFSDAAFHVNLLNNNKVRWIRWMKGLEHPIKE